MKITLKNLLENKIVLYVVFFLALTTVFVYMMANNCSAVLFFVLLALLTNYFSRNMIVILGCAIVGTHLLAVLNMFGSSREGFKEGATITEPATDASKPTTDNTLDTSKPETPIEIPPAEPLSKSTAPSIDISGGATDNTPDNTPDTTTPDVTNTTNATNAAFTNMGSNNKLDPLDITPGKDNLLAKNDKAKAKEKAYDLLESSIGKDNLKGIASDTQSLLKKQSELMDELKNVTPLLSQAMGMVNNLDLNNLTGMFDKLTDMMPNKDVKPAQ